MKINLDENVAFWEGIVFAVIIGKMLYPYKTIYEIAKVVGLWLWGLLGW